MRVSRMPVFCIVQKGRCCLTSIVEEGSIKLRNAVFIQHQEAGHEKNRRKKGRNMV